MFSACSKSKKTDALPPEIFLDTPTENQVFANGDNVSIKGSARSSTTIALMHVHISNNSTGELLVDIHRYPDASLYVIDESFLATSGTTYKIQLLVTDKFANETRLTRIVSCP